MILIFVLLFVQTHWTHLRYGLPRLGNCINIVYYNNHGHLTYDARLTKKCRSSDHDILPHQTARRRRHLEQRTKLQFTNEKLLFAG